jgi:hypothetical protein
MTLQVLTIGKREFVLLAKRDFERLAAQAERQLEDDYWTTAALEAEAKARSKREKPIPFEQIERELDAQKLNRPASRGQRRR